MRKLPQKETLEVEFKSEEKNKYPDRELLEEVVGMTNAKGGVIYLGIEDDGRISGVHPQHEDAVGVAALIANMTVPAVSVRAEVVEDEGYPVLAIEIPMSRSVVATRDGKMRRRRLKLDGTPENVPMYPYEIPGRLSELSRIDFSAQSVAGANMDDLDDGQRLRLRRIIQTRQGGEKNLLELSDDELDKALRLAVEENGRMIPTLTGMLLLGKEERIRDLVPTARSSFQVLEGTTIRMNEESTKPLLEVFEQYEVYTKAWNPEREVEYGLYRFPIPEFDEAAFREGVVNAFCHRDYTMLGSVRVAIDDEGLSISNPGGFIDGINLSNLLTAEPRGRNPALADAMKRIGLAEKTGRGIDRIYEGSIIYGRPWPDYSESTSQTVRLFIPRAKPDMGFATMIADEQNRMGKPLSIYTLMILSALKNERRAVIGRIVQMTGLGELKIRSSMEALVESGLVEASGTGKDRSFILSARVYRNNRKTAEYVRQSGIDKIRYPEMVIKLAKTQGGVVTKREVAELLKMTESQAYRIIKQLQAEGKLHLDRGGKHARYSLVE